MTRRVTQAFAALALIATPLLGTGVLASPASATPPAPTITYVNPSSGLPRGGDSVTIVGAGFTGAIAVDFGTTAASSFTVNSSTSITATTPPEAAGTVDTTVTTPAGTSATSAGDQFRYDAAPTITSLSPSSGSTCGDTSVTITGTNLLEPSAVDFGSTPAASFSDDSVTQITAAAPAGPAGTVDTTVTTVAGTSAISSADQFTYLSVPAVVSVSPPAGPTAGGTVVTVTGTCFTGATAVTFGTNSATSFTVNSSTSITATTPAGSAGSVDVTVNDPIGQGTLPLSYTYVAPPTITSITPNAGPTAGGTSVTIRGTNLASASVTFGGSAGTMTYDIPGQINVTIPPGTAGAADVDVTTTGGTTTDSGGFTYLPPPTITGVDPSVGTTAGGTLVTIDGANLTNAIDVNFGVTPATAFTVDSPTSISATTPPSFLGSVNVVVNTPGGTASDFRAFTYEGPPIISSVSPSSGPTAGGTSVNIIGAGFTGATAVNFGASPATAFTVVRDTQITATTPPGSPGATNVSVTTTGGMITDPGGFTYASAPVITSVTPSEGPAETNTEVTINGSNLSSASVLVGPNPGFVDLDTANQIIFMTPLGTVGADDLVVTTPGGTTTDPGGFTFLPYSTISSVTPSSGPATGGTDVTITGSGFTGATDVVFGSTLAPAFTVVSDTQVTATTPPGFAGTTGVQVNTPGGVPTDPWGFTYVVSDCDPALVTSPDEATALAGSPFSFTVTTTCNSSATIIKATRWPTGIRLVSNRNGTATIEGTPSAKYAGIYSVEITTALPGITAETFQAFALTVDNRPIFKSKSRYLAHTGTAFSYPITTDYGYPFPTITTVSALSAGVTLLDNGNGTAALTGTPGPLAGGVYPLTVTATNGVGPPVNQTFTLTVYQAPAVAPIANALGTRGTAITPIPVSDIGYPVPTLKASGLPPGVTLSYAGTSGSIAGTPAKSGTYNVTISSSSKAGITSQSFTLTVTP